MAGAVRSLGAIEPIAVAAALSIESLTSVARTAITPRPSPGNR